MIKIGDIKAKQDEMDKIQKELQGMIESYEKQEQAKNVYELEYPENGSEVCIIQLNGNLTDVLYHNDAHERFFKQGNIQTRYAGTLESKRRNLLTRFRQFRDKCNGDWVPDFGNSRTEKHHFYYSHERESFEFDWWCTAQEFNMFGYFKNKEDVQRAIELFGDEIKELFVEEV